MKILGIETSCDETAVALVDGEDGCVREIESLVSSQINIHKATGGVVPEVAAREHLGVIMPLLDTLIGKGRRTKIDAIAATCGPGLFSSVMVGAQTAMALSCAWGKPFIRVNHIEGHLYSSLINDPRPIAFPAVAFIVSGGHTELILAKDHGKYALIGRTLDDAAGEAFDKTAQMMGLGYPGGPAIAKIAEKGNPRAYNLPRPMLAARNFDFSFAGLKTAVLYAIRNGRLAVENPQIAADLAASTQAAIVDVLAEKAFRAVQSTGAKTLLAGGGVMANDALRSALLERGRKDFPGLDIRLPQKKYTTDNAAMIAAAGYYRATKKAFSNPLKVKADPNWELV